MPTVNFCGRCDEPIRRDEEFSEHDKLSPSAAGTTIYLHVKGCKKVPTRTTQVSLGASESAY
ncbi:hypothetical protein [Streptomyces sp. NPDC101455]|uniref:hypothetical protein n=1 Tax=Streptomyces sp. NPDC101455 TaxID=3366142 RepID=UPI00381BCFD3